MTAANIVVLIDIQNGFAQSDLTKAEGGSLYVPGGEMVGEKAAILLRHLSNATVVLSQDFHPANHISFASNHEGKEPLWTIRLERGADEVYRVSEKGELAQTLWLDHCIQGTKSALFVEPIMGELPEGLSRDLQRHISDPVMSETDERGNTFHVIRKGVNSDLDSYGIATENDGIETTAAPAVFKIIARKLEAEDVTEANIYIGGLATNFCVEFSHKDIYQYLVPQLERRGIKAKVYFLTDISAGIPIFVPGGAWPDLAAASDRMTSFGTNTATTEDVIRSTLSGKAVNATKPEPKI